MLLATAGTEAATPLRIKNFREIFASYEAITGADEGDTELLELFKLTKDRLPRAGVPQEFGSPVVLGMTELAGGFCKKAIAREKAQSYGERLLFSDIDFARGTNQFSDFLVGKLADQLAISFWQREAKVSEKMALSKMISDLSTGDPMAVVETEELLQVVCTTFGTSLAFLVK